MRSTLLLLIYSPPCFKFGVDLRRQFYAHTPTIVKNTIGGGQRKSFFSPQKKQLINGFYLHCRIIFARGRAFEKMASRIATPSFVCSVKEEVGHKKSITGKPGNAFIYVACGVCECVLIYPLTLLPLWRFVRLLHFVQFVQCFLQ